MNGKSFTVSLANCKLQSASYKTTCTISSTRNCVVLSTSLPPHSTLSKMSDLSDDDLKPPVSNHRSEEAKAAAMRISSLSDDESDEAPITPLQASDEAKAAVRRITALSDDDSEEPRPRTPVRPSLSPSRANTPSPGGDNPEPHHLANGEASKHSHSQSVPTENREMSPRLEDCYERFAGTHGAFPRQADIMHFPPNISFSMAVTDKLEKLPREQNPILYRLKPGLREGRSVVDATLDLVEKNPDPVTWRDFFQSNANLITWSDGSKTIAIGSQQFLLIEDAMASRHFLFRQGDNIETYEAAIKNVVRVQPSSTGDADVKLAMANAAKKAAGMRRAGRTMMRCMDKDGEQQEEKAKQESQRRERERLRLEARRRRDRQKHVSRNRGLTVDALESNDEDSGDDHVRRLEERVGANRLMRAKRAAPPPRPGISVKRRKAGRRKFVGSDDDEDIDSEESDL